MTETDTMSCVNTMENTFTVRAGRERTWTALTEPAELATWFADEVEVDLRVGGPYRFGGRHVPTHGEGAPVQQEITALEPGRLLAFTWSWAGTPTRCELRLEDDDDGTTTVHVKHQLEGSLLGHDDQLSRCLSRDFWLVVFGNLDEFVRKGRPALRPDYNDAGGDVRLSIDIDAPAATVWKTITEPDRMAAWLSKDTEFPATPRVDLRVGGEYTFGWTRDDETLGPREILELEPGRRLLYSWHHAGDATDRTEWIVESLAEDRSRLTVIQHGTASAREFCGYSNGWAAFMISLRAEAAAA